LFYDAIRVIRERGQFRRVVVSEQSEELFD